MPICKEQFRKIKSKYQYLSSWEIWADEGKTPKSNIGELIIIFNVTIDPIINKIAKIIITSGFLLR